MIRGSRVDPRAVEWLWRNRIPAGMITLVAGRPGQGKSLFTSYLAAEVTRQGRSVIFSNHEDSLHEQLVPRLEVAGVEMKRVYLPEEPFVLPGDTELLERMIKQIGARLVVLDAAAQHLSVSVFNDQQVRRALTPLSKVLQRTGAACVLVTHTKKGVSRSAHPLESIAGSGAGLVAAARLVYIFGPEPKDPDARILAAVKSNIGPVASSSEFALEPVDYSVKAEKGQTKISKVPRLKLITNQSKVTAATVVSFAGGRKSDAGDEPTDPTRLAMAEEWLTGLLKDGPVKVADVEAEGKKVKLSYGTIRRASLSISVVKDRKGYGKGGHWQWDLPKGHPLRKAREDKQVASAAGDLDAELTKLLATTAAPNPNGGKRKGGGP